MTRVSIVVNNHDYGRFLADAVDSALAQTWPDTQVVVVDDGSTDDSREVLAGYADRVVVVLQDNAGQAAAMNSGVARADGDVVVLLDADDRLDADAAARLAVAYERHPDAALLQGRLRATDAQLRPLGPLVPPAHVRLAEGGVAEQVARWELSSGLGPGGAVGLPMSTVHDVFPMPAVGFVRGADTYFLRAAALRGPVVALDGCLGDYRNHGANDSHQRELDLHRVRAGMTRYVACGLALREFAHAHGLRAPMDPREADDAIFLSQRLASLRLEPQLHPFSADRRLGLVRHGVRAAFRRRDTGRVQRLLHAAWFVTVGAAPRQAAELAARLLLQPLSRRR